jgi:aminoglycoside 6'-N-acetyltransferase I
MSIYVRQGRQADHSALVLMRTALWPDGFEEEHAAELELILGGTPPSTLPLVTLVAEVGDSLGGFVEVGLRSHADGCDPRQPVGFIEGWYVAPEQRGTGVGRALISAAEAWCREQGCKELASDTWIDNEESQRAHEALGFVVVDRCVNYRKRLK